MILDTNPARVAMANRGWYYFIKMFGLFGKSSQIGRLSRVTIQQWQMCAGIVFKCALTLQCFKIRRKLVKNNEVLLGDDFR